MSGFLILLLSPFVASLGLHSSHLSLPSHTYVYNSLHQPASHPQPQPYNHPQLHVAPKPYQPHVAPQPYHPHVEVNPYRPQPIVKPYHPQVLPKTHHLPAVSRPSVHLPYHAAPLTSPGIGLHGSGDIIGQTRVQTEALKADLKVMASDPRAAPILQRVFAGGNSACINNMEDAIVALETGTRLFENAGAEINQLVKSIKVFENPIPAPVAVRETANMIRLLDVLIPKLTPPTPSTCNAAGYDEFASLHSLGSLLSELSSKSDLYFTAHKRQSLKSSAKIVNRVTNFLSHLKETFSKFSQLCSSDQSYSLAAVSALGDLMTELAGLYSGLGGVTAAVEIGRQADFTRRVVANIQKFRNTHLITPGCSTPSYLASNLDDLATLIEEVGIDNLCRQLELGLDCASFF